MTATSRRLEPREQDRGPASGSGGVFRSTPLPPSEPQVFDTFTGAFQPGLGHGHAPVLMLSPIGYEELCSRAFFTALADGLAARGIASLRFDYPGTADALDNDAQGIDDWRAAARTAADRLRALTGRDEITLLGQGLGAALALDWASALGTVGAVVLLEPPASGRSYLRGLKAWGTMIASANRLAPEPAGADDLSVAGMALPGARSTAIKALNPAQYAKLPAAPILLLARAGSGPALQALVRSVRSSGAALTEAEFAGYDALLTDPTSAVVPFAAIETVTTWLAARPSTSTAQPARPLPLARTDLEGDGFTERPIRFGGARRLAGVMCLPKSVPLGRRAVVLANAGRDYHIGWGRSTVLQARALARAGVASLRFDVSGVGDSRASEGFEGEVLYSRQQCSDLAAAVDELVRAGYPFVGLVGRCSGAWAAFTVAMDDPRIDSLALLNTGYFIWDSSKTLAEVIRFSQRTVGDLGTTFLRRAGFRRLLAGELDVKGATRFLLRQANLRVARPLAFSLGSLTPESRRYRDLHALFSVLDRRKVRTRLIYSDRDASLTELRSFMGSRLSRLRRYPTVSACEIAGADHNFTQPVARDRVRDELVDFFSQAALEPATAHHAHMQTSKKQVPIEA